jgi:hypothetical protein
MKKRAGWVESMNSSTVGSLDNRSMAPPSPRTLYSILIGVYVLAMAWVWGGIAFSSGSRYIEFLLIQTLGFAGAASILLIFVFSRLRRVNEFHLSVSTDSVAIGLVVLITILIVAHWVALKRIPVLAAFAVDDVTQAALIRDSIHRTGIPLLGYIPALTIWSSIPFLGIYFIHRRQYKLSWLVLFIGFVYGLSMMQKSYPLIALAPPALYCFLSRRFIRMTLIISLAATGVLILFFVTNPHLRPSVKGFESSAPVQQSPISSPPPEKLSEVAAITTTSLFDRIFLLPGNVVTQWFATFPQKMGYEKGCGYRFVAPLLGCEFINNPERLYALYYPEQYGAGVHGTYNAAHFAEEYANFGPIGLALSGILAAFALAAASIATSRAGLPAAVSLNFPPIMALTSVALHTTLLTGGWMMLLLLTYLLYPPSGRSQQANPRNLEKTRSGRGGDRSQVAEAY